MDFKKLAIFIIMLGAIVLAYGGIQYATNQPVKFDKSKSKKTVLGGFNDIGNWFEVNQKNMIRQDKRKSATIVIISGAVVVFIGVGIWFSAKKENKKEILKS